MSNRLSHRVIALGHTDGLPSGTVGELVFFPVSQGTSDVRFNWVSPFSDPNGSLANMSLGGAEVTVVPEPGFAAALAIGAVGLAFGTRRGPRRR